MRNKEVIGRVAEAALRTSEMLSKQPLLELCGDHRVLVENHNGIGDFSAGRIDIKTKFGLYSIDGLDLEICRMTAEQIVISGEIDTITLFRETGR